MSRKEIKYIDIPKEFHSFSEGKLFERCIECDKYLLDEGTTYFVEKAVKNYEGFQATDIIFEYAICLECAERLRKQISKESMQNIESFFSENINMYDRMQIIQENPENPQAWMDQCLINGKSKDDLEEFQIYAQCNGKHLEMTHMPYLISGQVLEQITHLLSAQTLDELDRFLNNHFGPPPELREIIPNRRVVLI